MTVDEDCFEAIERGDVDAAVAFGADGEPGLLRALAQPSRSLTGTALRVVARTAPTGDGFADAVMATREAEPPWGLRTAALAALCPHSERARMLALTAVADPDERERVALVRRFTDLELDFAAGAVADLLGRGAMTFPSALGLWACRYVLQVEGASGRDSVAALLAGPPHRDAAAEALAEVQDPRALDRLIERWRGGEFMVAASIGGLGDPRAIPALAEEMTRDRGNRTAEWQRQHWGARALAAIGDTSALPTLYRVRLPAPMWSGPSDDAGTSIRAEARAAIEDAIRALEASY